VEERLLEVMSQHPFPRMIPVLIIACSDDKRGRLYVTGAKPDAVYPEYSKTPR
jgi:hypothetical protein